MWGWQRNTMKKQCIRCTRISGGARRANDLMTHSCLPSCIFSWLCKSVWHSQRDIARLSQRAALTHPFKKIEKNICQFAFMQRSKNNVPLSLENAHRRSLNKSYQKCTIASNYSHAYMNVIIWNGYDMNMKEIIMIIILHIM